MSVVALLWLWGCGATHRIEGQAHTITQLDREVLALQQENALLHTRLGTCPSTSPDDSALYTELSQVFSGSGVQVSREGSGVRLEIPQSLLFAPSGQLRQEAGMVVDLLGMAMHLHPRLDALVIGHAEDGQLSAAQRKAGQSPWELGASRALALVRAMQTLYPLEARRFTIASRGATDPRTAGDTPEGQSLNRRVEVLLRPATP
jgi:flagellar motor protein MotB